MLAAHPDAELAPRDIVARAVQTERASGRGAFLDCRGALGAGMREHFPTVHAACAAAGLDPANDLIPIAPAAHYFMGGVVTHENARTTLAGLWAVGEAACTGLHGANRLASNSLLEAVVMSARAAEDIAGCAPVGTHGVLPPEEGPAYQGAIESARLAGLQETMTAKVGVVRSAQSLREALAFIEDTAGAAARLSPLANMVEAARLMAVCAYYRQESRGGHYREDFPVPSGEVRRSMITGSAARALSEEALLGG
jgi:L-aspartate oxidase